jgi:hypothetical protein
MIHLNELQERARVMTDDAMRGLPPIPEAYRHDLVLGMRAEGHLRIFEMYMPGKRPEDALILTCARLDERTGEGTVQVYPERWTQPHESRK